MSNLLHARLAIAALFLLSVFFFVERGAYRALRDSRTPDFATVYGAARCWMHNENPYAGDDIRLELARSGAPAPVLIELDRHPSVYFASALPFVSLVAWLPWTAANIAWCLLSMGFFAGSLVALLQYLPLSQSAKWLTVSLCLFFSPTYVGIRNGNPSVIAISLTILCLHLARQNRHTLCGILFAVTLCLKPQIAICSFLAFLLWRSWRSLIIGSATELALTVLAISKISSLGQKWMWLESFKDNVAVAASPLGFNYPGPFSPYAPQLINAQTLSYLLISNDVIANALVLFGAAGMMMLYYLSRKRDTAADSRVDSAFVAALTLTMTYHRYYDGELLLLLVPAAVYLWQVGRTGRSLMLGTAFALLAFPLQSIFDRTLGLAASDDLFTRLVLLRHQPMAIVAVVVALSLRWPLVRHHTASSPGG